jgi:selenocysteine-specific elongation factor
LAGQRLALNLQGIDLDQAARGDVVVPRGLFRTTRTVDVRLDYLASAPRNLKHRSTLRLHAATSEVSAQLILLDRDILKPGESAYAQLRLTEPLLLLSGDSYILRVSSPAATMGGGVVLDPFPPRRRRRTNEALQLLDALNGSDNQRTLSLLISQSLLSGVTFEELVLRSGLARKTVDVMMAAMLTAGEAIQMIREPRTFLARGAFDELKGILVRNLSSHLANHSLKEGMGKEELKTRLPKRSNPRFFTSLLAELERDGLIVTDRDIVKPLGLAVKNNPSEDGLGKQIMAYLELKGIEPPTIREIMDQCLCSEKTVRENLALLTRSCAAVRISSDLFYAAGPLDGLREKLLTRLRETGEIIPAEFRDLTGLSRKFLIPLLEYFDSEKLTIRVGDKRLLRKR